MTTDTPGTSDRPGVFDSAGVPRVIGHRGAMALAPENTLASFRRAAADGARWIEFDVHLSCDGVPVVVHDDDLARTTNGSGPVADRTAGDLAALDAGSWFSPTFSDERVPTLSETIGLSRELGLGMNVEIKPSPDQEAETARAALAVVKAADGLTPRSVVFSSFKTRCLEVLRDTGPEWPRGWLINDLPPAWADEARRLGCFSLHPKHTCLTSPEIVRSIHDEGAKVLTFTVNDPARATELLNWEVDAVITDDPASVLSALG